MPTAEPTARRAQKNRHPRIAIAVAAMATLNVARVTRAADAPTALFPAAGATNVCPDTPLRLTFAAPPKVGSSGTIKVLDASDNSVVATVDVTQHVVAAPKPKPGSTTVPAAAPLGPTATQSIGGLPGYNYYTVLVNGNEADVYLPNHALAYGKTYAVTIDPGAIADYAGTTDPKAWQFTTKPAAAPAAGPTKITVAADGTGDFCTVQGAIDFVPDKNAEPTTITLKNGTYVEQIYIGGKNAITLAGEDRKNTVIAYADNNVFNSSSAGGAYHRGLLMANRCHDLTLTNLTVRNTTPRGGSQAEAVIFNGAPDARATVRGVDLYSYQDTLQINGQAYIEDCYIEGDVDFMWGTGPCFFENCHAYGTRSKGYYTQIRNKPSNHGYVYHRCTFDGPAGVTGMFLSRIDPATFPYSEVSLIDCALGDAVSPVGWLLDQRKNAEPADASNVRFVEFGSHAPDGKPVDVSQRLPASKQLKNPDDSDAIAHYSNPAWVLGGWNPTSVPGAATRPALGSDAAK